MKQNEQKRAQSIININHTLNKQKACIDQLVAEKSEILRNLKKAESESNEKTNDSHGEAITVIANKDEYKLYLITWY